MTLKEDLRSGKITFGTWITINHPDVPDALSDLDLDWLVFDMEHAPLDIPDIEVLTMPLKNSAITPLIRVPWNDFVVIKRALDIGAKGILAPWVNDREEAERVVSAASYPPRGIRGVGPRRCTRFGEIGFLDYYKTFEENERVIAVQVETKQALDNLEEILSVPGIDVAYIGPNDLTTNFGIPIQYGHPKFVEAVKKVIKTCEICDVAPGIHTFSVDMAKKAVESGFRFIAIMSDLSMMKNAFRRVLAELGRGELEDKVSY